MTLVHNCQDISNYISTHTLRGERDATFNYFGTGQDQFQLTRSVGSVTAVLQCSVRNVPFQLTRSVGSVTYGKATYNYLAVISTHTLRGERDAISLSK